MSSSEDDDSPELETLNISNDEYYQPKPGFKKKSKDISDKLSIPRYGSQTIQHSLPAYDLWRPFFPTYMSEVRFRNFHRPKLRHYAIGPQARVGRRKPKAFPVKSLTASIYRHQKILCRNVINAINSDMTREEIVNKFLLIRHAKELTAKHGEIFLFEYCEEFPPILNQIGMAANIKTYHLTNPNLPKHSDTLATNEEPKMGYDEALPTSGPTKPIYFGQLESKMMVIENNMSRAPIYKHELPSCDFLIVRTRNSIYIRQISSIFTVGQIMPLVAIPKPNEANITKFRLDLSNTYIHKLFLDSPSNPPTISFDLLAKFFPDYDPKVLKRRLVMKGAAHQLIEGKSRYNRGTSNYGLISLKEHRRSFTPECYCLNMSMLAARQRLRELNYSESMIDPPNEAEMETEVLAAPWNTSRAVLNTSLGRCYLDFSKHLIDPTGLTHEGFSCVAWSKSPTEEEQSKQQNGGQNQKQKDSVEIKNPQQTKIREEKTTRRKVYQQEAQMINDVQDRVLGSSEILSSDEENDEDLCDEESLMDSSFDEQLNVLSKLVGGQTVQELNFEREEAERREMLKNFNNLDKSPIQSFKSSQGKNSKDLLINVAAFKNKILRITRTYDSEEGEIERTEIVRDPKIIALYVKQKGGSQSATQTNNCERINDSLNNMSNISRSSIDGKRRSSISLGPKELCRADGIVLTISKSVLNSRSLRKQRRDYRMQENISTERRKMPVNAPVS